MRSQTSPASLQSPDICPLSPLPSLIVNTIVSFQVQYPSPGVASGQLAIGRFEAESVRVVKDSG